jgi:CheY-like chemotaxis protein
MDNRTQPVEMDMMNTTREQLETAYQAMLLNPTIVPWDQWGVQDQPAPLAPAAAVERHRILIVDDEPRIRLAMRGCLEAEGYEVEEAADGRSGINAVVSGSPDLLIVDLAMPVLDGLSTLRLLAETYAPVRPRVIVLTAYASIAAMERAQECGVSAFVEKPIAPDALRDIVRRVLREPLPPVTRHERWGDGDDTGPFYG